MEWTEIERERLAKLEAMRAEGIDPYPARVQFAKERVMAADAIKQALALKIDDGRPTTDDRDASVVGRPSSMVHPETAPIALMGRVVGKRVMGKASFVHIEDGSAKIQFYARVGEDSIDVGSFSLFKELDLGDFIEARGPLFITKTGEPSLRVTAWRLLSKSVSPLPIAKEEKQPDGTFRRYSAFTSPELRFRQRYTDLAVNPDVREVFWTRAKVIKAIRDYFDNNGFLEVETPILQPLYGGAAARPFVTHHNELDQDMYLRISFELYLKRLLVGGIERVYEIGRDFRNEGVSYRHNPEFTQIEFYAAYWDLFDVMDFTEQFIQHAARAVLPNGKAIFRGQTIDFLQPWTRLTLHDAILSATGVDYKLYPDFDSLKSAIKAKGLEYSSSAKTWGKLVDGLMGDYVEKNLIQPTFLYEYPRDISPFAKSKLDEPNTVERFEGFMGGMELCNAFTELNDPLDQAQRFLDEQKNAEGEEANPVDEDYLRAMRYGMPPNGGFGMGIDRFVMVLTGKDSIREVLLFPALRSDE